MIQVSDQRRKQLEYLGLSEHDLEFLKNQQPHFEAITDIVVDQLYENIYGQPELARIIDEHTTIEKLKETQRWYFLSLVSGTIDEEFIERRLQIGKIHSKVGLTADWYLGTYMRYLDIAVQNFRRIVPDQWADITLALSKMFNLDSQLVLEAYEQEEKKHIKALYEERKETLAKVNQAVQELATMMVELGESSQSVADTATHTAEIQEQAYKKVEMLHKKIGEIGEVGSILQEISDQTHLLGLNAAIEAAHTGEAGKGFEIVANEIRKLAAHSKQSLEVILTTLEEISQLLQEVVRDSESTSTLARDQAASSEELSSFVNMIEAVMQDLKQIG